jgi:hypothetical protein
LGLALSWGGRFATGHNHEPLYLYSLLTQIPPA